MKMKYEKPLIAVENYMLSQTIADCGTKIGFSNSYCILTDSDADKYPGIKSLAAIGYFTDACDFQANIKDPYDGICYHGQAATLFTS